MNGNACTDGRTSGRLRSRRGRHWLLVFAIVALAILGLVPAVASAAAISRVGSLSATGATIGLPAGWQTGDLALVFAFRDGSGTAPTPASGFTSVRAVSTNPRAAVLAYRYLQAGDSTFGFTNATDIQVIVLRGTVPSAPVGTSATSGANSGAMSYPALSGIASTSWVVGFGGSQSGAISAYTAASMTLSSYSGTGADAQLGQHYRTGITSFGTTNWSGSSSTAWTTIDVPVLADTVAPTVSSIAPTATPTNAASATFTVTFNEAVNGVGTGNFSLNTSGVTGASVTSVSGSGNTRTVTVNTGSGDGSIRLDLSSATPAITDIAGNAFTATYSSGTVLTVNKSIPTVSSIAPTSTPTNAASTTFLVTFSESVTGVASGNFSLTTSGVSGASITGVGGSGATRTVTVNTGSGSGTIRLDLSSTTPAITDFAGGNALTATYSSGTVLTVDKTAPTVTVNQAASQADPAYTNPIHFTVVFSEAVSGFANSDVTVGGTAGGSKTVTISGSGPTYDVAVDGVTTPGTVTASIAASRVTDAAGNNNAASTSTDNTVTYASGLSVTGASVLSSTQVKITFSAAVDATAASTANYAISPA